MKSLLGNTRKPEITFFKSGRIDISASVAKHLRLCGGDVIDVMCDNDELYLYVKVRQPNGKHKASVYQTNRHGHNFRTYSKILANAVLNECKTQGVAKLAVATPIIHEQYGTMLPLITSPELFCGAECAGTGIDLHLSFPQRERKIYVPTSF